MSPRRADAIWPESARRSCRFLSPLTCAQVPAGYFADPGNPGLGLSASRPPQTSLWSGRELDSRCVLLQVPDQAGRVGELDCRGRTAPSPWDRRPACRPRPVGISCLIVIISSRFSTSSGQRPEPVDQFRREADRSPPASDASSTAAGTAPSARSGLRRRFPE